MVKWPAPGRDGRQQAVESGSLTVRAALQQPLARGPPLRI